MRILLTYILRLIDVIIFARRYTTRSHRAILFYPHTRRAFYTFEKLERYEHSPARVELQRPDPRVVDLVHAREHQVAFELYRKCRAPEISHNKGDGKNVDDLPTVL